MTVMEMAREVAVPARIVVGLIVIGYLLWGFFGAIEHVVKSVLLRRRERGSR